jgi:hypothetical protein
VFPVAHGKVTGQCERLYRAGLKAAALTLRSTAHAGQAMEGRVAADKGQPAATHKLCLVRVSSPRALERPSGGPRSRKQASGAGTLEVRVCLCAIGCVPPRELMDGTPLGQLSEQAARMRMPSGPPGSVVGYAGPSGRKGLEKSSIGCMELTASIGRCWLVCRGDGIPHMIPAHSCHVIASVGRSHDIRLQTVLL